MILWKIWQLLLFSNGILIFKKYLKMGNEGNRGDNSKNNRNDPAKKKPVPPPPRIGKKKKNKGIDAATKLPSGKMLDTQSLRSPSAG